MWNLINALLLISLTFTAHAEGKFRKDFKKQLYVVGIGQIKLDYIFSGEPVSRPRSLQIYIKCEKATAWKPVGEYQMCELKDYELDPNKKILKVTYLDGRVNPISGQSYCDRAGEGEVDLKPLCAKN